ncbi:MAG: monovalent cation/H(+) antiporter subunit G [Spirochaetia bacterium]|jgi:monovalent cation/proton antiporter MnhG/PhaG subunit|nr:monovalent cation/H(+) antiporter subunit G [Spirochaetia bacterium]
MREYFEIARIVFAIFCFITAVVFGSSGIIGLYIYKAPLSRLQGSALCGTTAVFSIILGCLAISPSWAFFFRLLVIGIIFLVSNPLGTHFIAAYTWKKLGNKNQGKP